MAFMEAVYHPAYDEQMKLPPTRSFLRAKLQLMLLLPLLPPLLLPLPLLLLLKTISISFCC